MRVPVFIIAFTLCTMLGTISSANNIALAQRALNEFKLTSMASDNLKIVFNNIKPEMDDASYKFTNVGKLSLVEGSLIICDTILLTDKEMTETNKLKSRFNNVELVSKTLYPDFTVRKFVSNKPTIEYIHNKNKIVKIIREPKFTMFKNVKYLDAIK